MGKKKQRKCDAITGAVGVKGWSHSLEYCDKHPTSPKTSYAIKLPAKENCENDYQWNFFPTWTPSGEEMYNGN